MSRYPLEDNMATTTKPILLLMKVYAMGAGPVLHYAQPTL